jgi:hypothetical protein
MNKVLRGILVLPALLFILLGLQWMVDPAAAAKGLGMTLMDGMGRSSQMGDVGSFFLMSGTMALIGVITLRKEWFYAPAMLVAGAAVFRTVAWLAHDAPFATVSITIEVVLTALLLFAASRIKPA